MRVRYNAIIIVISLLVTSSVHSHDARPAYLEMKETQQGYFAVLFRNPIISGDPLPVRVEFSNSAHKVIPMTEQQLPDSLVQRWLISFENNNLIGQRVEFLGLQATLSDVLFRLEFAEGVSYNQVVTPEKPWVVISRPASMWQVSWDYVMLGFEHILKGADHLLFVFALLLLVTGWRRLLLTITAFTIAHSVTLALATLGFISVPSPPVESVIALSVMFLARELIQVHRGRRSLTAQYPWLVAIVFGLLHGLGFAGALAGVGLPSHEIPVALLMFNIGVELGQLFFIGIMLMMIWHLSRISWRLPNKLTLLPAYGLGSVAAFWLVERLALFGV